MEDPQSAMLRDAWFLLYHDLKYLLGRRETLLWTFVMPIIFFYFIGSATSSFARRAGPDGINLVQPADAGFLADELVTRLKQLNFEPATQPMGRELRIPSHFTDLVLAGKPVTVEFIRHGSDGGADFDKTRVTRAVYTLLADYVATSSQGGTPDQASFAALTKRPRNVTVKVTNAGKRRFAPAGFEQAVPGILVMFTLLVLFTSGSASILAERRQGILRRLASAPMSRISVVVGKWGARVTLGLVQIAFAMITGAVLFHVDWGGHLGAVVAVLAAYACMTAALGVLLGNFARTEGQVIGFGVIASNIMAALGGCWWPIEITPRWAQQIALVFPTGWAMDALHKLISFGDSPMSVLPHLAAFAAVALVAGYILARKFRFE